MCQNRLREGNIENTNEEENRNAGEDHVRHWDYLKRNYWSGKFSRVNIQIFTRSTSPSRAVENEYRTFTVGVTHFVSLSPPFWDWVDAGIWSRRTVRIASGESQG